MDHAFKKSIWNLIRETRGNDLPIQFTGRLEDELSSFSGTDFLDNQHIILKLMEEAEADGSDIDVEVAFGSSLLNYVFCITDTDPLPPHYTCPVCGKMKFVPEAKDGFDLPVKTCCNKNMHRNGHYLPFEMLLSPMEEHGLRNITVRIPDSFRDSALRRIREFYSEDEDYIPVVLAEDQADLEDFNTTTVVLIPRGDEMPELDEKGLWHADERYIYSEKNYRTINLHRSARKEEIKWMIDEYGIPSVDELLSPDVLEAAKRAMESRMDRHENRPLQTTCLNFSTLLAIAGYMRSTYDPENPVFNSVDRYANVFTNREEVWYMIMDHIKPEYRIGSGFATNVTELTRKGRFTLGRMDPLIERQLREIGIDDYWIDQMKLTCYLPPKADVINTLMDELKLAWYKMQE